MKIKNYKYGYNDTFNCSIHGTIEMTNTEFKKVKKYLFNPKVQWGYKSMLTTDLNRIVKSRQGFLINIRVRPTEKIVDHFKLKGYKRGNYALRIIQDSQAK